MWFNLPSPLRLVPAIAFFGLMFLVGYLTLRTITERVENSSWPTDAATAHPLPRFVVLLVTTTAAAGLMNFAFRAGWFTPLVLFSAFALMI